MRKCLPRRAVRTCSAAVAPSTGRSTVARSGAWVKKTSLIVVRGLVATRHSRGARLIEQARMLSAEQGEQAHEVPGREDVEQAELVEDAGPAAVALGRGACEPLLVGLRSARTSGSPAEQRAEEGEHAEREDDPQAGPHGDEEEPDPAQRVSPAMPPAAVLAVVLGSGLDVEPVLSTSTCSPGGACRGGHLGASFERCGGQVDLGGRVRRGWRGRTGRAGRGGCSSSGSRRRRASSR